MTLYRYFTDFFTKESSLINPMGMDMMVGDDL